MSSSRFDPLGDVDLRTPITILTGFLGSGKTTLLNHILQDKNHGLRFAIIENEFGEVGVDEKLIADRQELPTGGGEDSDRQELPTGGGEDSDRQELPTGGGEGEDSPMESPDSLVEVMNGCLCCTVRGDLPQALLRLFERVRNFDGILIETTGLADPGPVAQSILGEPEIQMKFRLDGVITVVDAVHLEQHLDGVYLKEGEMNVSREQLAFADRILLNKCDLVGVDSRDSGVPGTVTEVIAPSGAAETAGGTSSSSSSANFSNFTPTSAAMSSSAEEGILKLSKDAEAEIQRIERLIMEISPEAEIIRTCFAKADPSKHLLNIKSFDVQNVKVRGANIVTETGPSPSTHKHPTSVSSVSWVFPDLEMNMTRLRRWMNATIDELEADLFRYKGVLAMKGFDEKLVFQGVHDMFSCNFSSTDKWEEGERRESRFVFIGRHVKEFHGKKLHRGLLSCEAEHNPRFPVGTEVEAKVAGGWSRARVNSHWDMGNTYRLGVLEGKLAGREVHGPIDDDIVIRLPSSSSGANGDVTLEPEPTVKESAGAANYRASIREQVARLLKGG